MRDRGVDVRFFIHIDQAGEAPADPRSYGQQAVRAVMEETWPFGDPRPHVYYDARAPGASPAVQHARQVRRRGRRMCPRHERELHAASARTEHWSAACYSTTARLRTTSLGSGWG